MNDVDYTQPIEVAHSDGRTLAAWVDPEWRGAGAPPIWTEGALFAASDNMLRRIGWTVRNVVAGAAS